MAKTNEIIPHHLEIGAYGEALARQTLEQNGIKTLDRNWRHGGLELDLVGEQGDTIVFIEVKTRSSTRWGGPLEGLTKKKKENLIKAANFWLSEHNAWHRACRFDVVCIVLRQPEDSFSVEHIPNAFDSGTALHSRHSAWQPW